jgi:hypothetical protein
MIILAKLITAFGVSSQKVIVRSVYWVSPSAWFVLSGRSGGGFGANSGAGLQA